MSPRLVCWIMGPIFIVVAAWGFITGDEVLIFHVNTAHNVVHLMSGVLALICAYVSMKAARLFCIISGAVYALVAVLGFLGVQTVVDLLHLNQADNWLHLVLGVLFLVAGLMPTVHLPRAPGGQPRTA